jgi:hypothetical protein
MNGTQFRVETCRANKVWENLIIALVIGGCVCKNFFIKQTVMSVFKGMFTYIKNKTVSRHVTPHRATKLEPIQ